MKLNENLQDAGNGVLFVIFMVGAYITQHKLVAVTFDGLVNLSDTVSGWIH